MIIIISNTETVNTLPMQTAEERGKLEASSSFYFHNTLDHMQWWWSSSLNEHIEFLCLMQNFA